MNRSAANQILIVDDDPAVRRLLRAVLRGEYVLEEAASGEEALGRLSEFAPAIVLLDIQMPGLDGHETCRQIKANPSSSGIQVIMVSARSSKEEQLRAYEAGADDYLVKPFDPQELRSRVRLHSQLRDATAQVSAIRGEIESRDAQLRRLAEQRAQEVIAIQDVAVFTLAKVAESRDQEAAGHLTRMRAYSQVLAEELAAESPYAGYIDHQFLDDLYRSSPLHDIGKVGIRDGILLKPSPLTRAEFAVMRQHTVIGANILDEAVSRSPGGGFLSMAALIARFHHERFDGAGYPTGLDGEDIPLAARIVAVADVYDALTSVRPYKSAFSPERARQMIVGEAGAHFDPVVVRAFRARFGDFLRIQQERTEEYTIHSMAPSTPDPDLVGAEA